MDPTCITPFLGSLRNVFVTMLNLPVTFGEARVAAPGTHTHAVTGLITFSGAVQGHAALSFPKAVAERVVARLAGQPIDSQSPDFADAIGELANLALGGAKSLFPNARDISISCPTVKLTKRKAPAVEGGAPRVIIPCVTECGEFTMEIAVARSAVAQPHVART